MMKCLTCVIKSVTKAIFVAFCIVLIPIILVLKSIGVFVVDVIRVVLFLYCFVVYVFEKIFSTKLTPVCSFPEQEKAPVFRCAEERVFGIESCADVENLKVEKFESCRTSEKEYCAFLVPYVISQWDVVTPVDRVVRNAYETLRFNGNIPNENGVKKCTALIWKSDSAIGVIELQYENKWEIKNIQKINISFYRPGKGGGEVDVKIQLRDSKRCIVAFVNYTGSIEETEIDAQRLRNLFEPAVAVEMEDQGYNC